MDRKTSPSSQPRRSQENQRELSAQNVLRFARDHSPFRNRTQREHYMTSGQNDERYNHQNFDEPLISLSPPPSERPVSQISSVSIEYEASYPLRTGPSQRSETAVDRPNVESLLDKDLEILHPLPQPPIPKVADSAHTSAIHPAYRKAPQYETVQYWEDQQNKVHAGWDTNPVHHRQRGRRVSETSVHRTKCDDCGELGEERFYCNVCSENFCARCWERDRKHRKNQLTEDGVPHEKIDHRVAEKIKHCLKPREDEDPVKMHVEDAFTTWFGVTYDQLDELVFEDFGRFGTVLTDGSADQRGSRYPGLVSFVGQTGAGKSTLIKMLIDLQNHSKRDFESPIVGSVNANIPTSGDVHLYSDPLTFWKKCPILYADCEGLQGGEREPLGAKSRHKDKITGQRRTPSFEKKLRKVHQSSKRELTWANTQAKRTREFAVTNLYPRLLFTFSDAIIFVSKNPRIIENTIETLIQWAAAALEASSNQPLLPHLIIVLNASENTVDPEQYNVNFATRYHTDIPIEAVRKNPNLVPYVRYWTERQRNISSATDLLLSYYRSIRVVRLPTGARPKIISEQVEKLYYEIERTCEESRKHKQSLRMMLSAEELQPYLQSAFDHFATDLDKPFDFVKASFTNNRIPLDFGGNILRMAINMMEEWEDTLDGPHIFSELSKLVASCIMLDVVRNGIPGEAMAMLNQRYLVYLDDVLDDFCTHHWPCEFVDREGRCVNVKATHGSKGHQIKSSGKVVAIGPYQSSFTFESYRKFWIKQIYQHLNALLKKHSIMLGGIDVQDADPKAVAFKIHCDYTLRPFFKHVGSPKRFVSHSTCFCCLIHPPEHGLPCGHVICTPCLYAQGKAIGKCMVRIQRCPLQHGGDWRFWEISLKPPGAGVRVLTLDGGGIRGIAELEILRILEKELGGKIPIQYFFDLIVGTSAGGLIALALGVENWPVNQCITKFEEYCNSAFKPRRIIRLMGFGKRIAAHYNSIYETTGVQNALCNTFGDEYLFGGERDGEHMNHANKVALVATIQTGLRPVILSNYNRPPSDVETRAYKFHRPEKPYMELKIWEAARATSAAPTYFKPFSHEVSKQVYVDGGLRHNNPVAVADSERRHIWPDGRDSPPDILLSLGTGYCVTKSQSVNDFTQAQGAVSGLKALYRIAVDHIQSSLDAEQAWNNYTAALSLTKDEKFRYRRLNVPLSSQPPKLDDVGEINNLKKQVREVLPMDEVREIADHLIASCFMFERASAWSRHEDGSISCSGSIQCRFPPRSEQIKNLGQVLFERQMANSNVCFVIEEIYREKLAQQILVTEETIREMIRNEMFSIKVRKITLSSELSSSQIRLCLNGFGSEDQDRAFSRRNSLGYPISGFPRRLCQEESDRIGPARGSLALNSTRRRTSSQRKQRVPIDEFMLDEVSPQSADEVLDNYSSANYQIGGASAEQLSSMRARLTTPRSLPEYPYYDPSYEILQAPAELSSLQTPVELPNTWSPPPDYEIHELPG